MNHPNELAIVDGSRNRLVDSEYTHCGISVDLYQFSRDPATQWNQGHIFHANRMGDISFDGTIDAFSDNNKRDATFFVQEPNEQSAAENMVVRSLSVKHSGILKTFGAGYNTQISSVVSAFRKHEPTHTLAHWLQEQKQKEVKPSTSIPSEVKEVIRIAYQAIVAIWLGDSTSDALADPESYHMIGNRIKINPLRLRDKNVADIDDIPLRIDFGQMISDQICTRWNDGELLDFVELLHNPRAGVRGILGAPVLLLPAQRELMYHNYDKGALSENQMVLMEVIANLIADWKNVARNEDPALKEIIEVQARRGGFSLDLYGALHFANIVTAHYPQHFRNMDLSTLGFSIEGRVDLLLKKVLPRLLSRRYNADYAAA